METAYRTYGDGLPLILLHGFGLDHNIWNPLLGGLETSFRVIVPDMPGFGESPGFKQEFTMARLGKLFAGFVHDVAGQNAVFLGHSMGGYIALELLSLIPNTLSGVGLIHSHPFGDDPGKQKNRDKTIAFLEKHGSMPYVKESIPGLFSQHFASAHPETVRECVERVEAVPPEYFIAYLQAMKTRKSREEALRHCSCPVLIHIGRYDKLIDPDKNLVQCTLPPVVQFTWLEQAGHMGMLEDPAKTLQSIRSFMDFTELLSGKS